MHAIVLTDYGDVDKLELREVPEPQVGVGDVKVRVAASSVNPIDWKIRSGAYRSTPHLERPIILGDDASGEIVAVGAGVRSYSVGARVLGLVTQGYAEYVVDKEDAWAEVPTSMELVDAAALPQVVLTGTQLIEEALRPRRGDVVLITGAVGSVGRSAVCAAQALGAKIIAGVRGTQKGEAAKSNSDVIAIDDDGEIERLPQLDSIADTVGGQALQKLLIKVKRGGTVASVVGEPAEAKALGLEVRLHRVHPDRSRLTQLAKAVAEGELVIPIARRMPLEQIREAQTLAERGAGGKVVLLVR